MFFKNTKLILFGIILVLVLLYGSSSFVGNIEVYAQAEPNLFVEINHDRVEGRDWPLGNEVILEIDDPATPEPIDYTDSQEVWEDEYSTIFVFNLGEAGFDVEPGHLVTVTDGETTKEHTAFYIEITNVDMGANTVAGYADPGSDLIISAHPPCDESVPVSADETGGYWIAYFVCELETAEYIQAEQYGENNTVTSFFWDSPFLQAEINHDWVDGWNWPSGNMVSITIMEPGNPEPVYSAENEVVDGFVNFNLGEDGFDLVPGHTVTLSDGEITKTHTVLNIEITSVDMVANTVEGYADPSSELTIFAHYPCDQSVPVTASDVDGYWSASFDCALVEVDGVSAEQYGPVSTMTSFNWSPPPEPSLVVGIHNDWVEGRDWTLGSTVTLEIDDPDTPEPIDYSDSKVVWEDEYTTIFVFEYWETGFDIEPGHVVTVTDGITTKTHTAFNIGITGMDTDADSVNGYADPGSDLWIYANDPCGESVPVTADGSGVWIAYFVCELDMVDGVSAEQYGDNNTLTRFDWSPPALQVEINHNWVDGWNWSSGNLVFLTVMEPGNPDPVFYEETEVNPDTNVHFELGDMFDLEAGHMVTLSDGETTKTHTAFYIEITSVDMVANTVEGYADPGSELTIFAHWPCDESIPVTVGEADGYWIASFGCALDTVDGVSAEQYADRTTLTSFNWSPPFLHAEINHDWVDGYNWPVGNLVSLTIMELGNPEPIYYAENEVMDDSNVYFDLRSDGFDLMPGHIVTLSDGEITKTHTVFYIEIINVDTEENTVEGYADPESELWVSAQDPCWEGVPVTADGEGFWVAHFGCALDTVDGISVEQYGPANTMTSFNWSPPSLHVEVNFNWVDGTNWPLGDMVTLTIDDPDTGDPVDYLDVQEVRTDDCWEATCVNFDLSEAGFDIKPGHIVTLTNGEITMIYTVAYLEITRVDFSANTIEGYAEPGSMLSATAHTPCWEDVPVTADEEDGYWIAYFLCDLSIVEFVSADQYNPTDGTGTSFLLGMPLLEVGLFYDYVFSLGWLPGATVTLTIDDPDSPSLEDYTDTQIVGADPEGGYDQVGFNFRGEYYVEPGHIVTLSDGGITIVYEVEYLEVTTVDPETDMVAGFAEPGMELTVIVGDPYWVNLPVFADETTGAWAADFSGIVDLVPGDWGWATTSDEWEFNHTVYNWSAPVPTTYAIRFGWDVETVHAEDVVELRTGWAACTPGLVKAFQKAVHIDITLDGLPLYAEGEEILFWNPIEPAELNGCIVAPDGSKASLARWIYELGSLEPGIHEVYVHYWLDHPVIDGGDWDGDGIMDRSNGTIIENTITIIVK